MSTEDNKATTRRFFEEGWNQGNWAVFDELATTNWVYHDPSFTNVRTLADYKRRATEIRNAFPEFHVTIDDMIAEGDKVVVRATVGGTNNRCYCATDASPRGWRARLEQTGEHGAFGPARRGRPKREPVKTPEPRKTEEGADHEQEYEHEHMKRHHHPRYLKGVVGIVCLS